MQKKNIFYLVDTNNQELAAKMLKEGRGYINTLDLLEELIRQAEILNIDISFMKANYDGKPISIAEIKEEMLKA